MRQRVPHASLWGQIAQLRMARLEPIYSHGEVGLILRLTYRNRKTDAQIHSFLDGVHADIIEAWSSITHSKDDQTELLKMCNGKVALQVFLQGLNVFTRFRLCSRYVLRVEI